MKINNSSVVTPFKSIYYIFFSTLTAGILFHFLGMPPFLKELLNPLYLIGGSLGVILIGNAFGHKYFEYDSLGEVLMIKTKSVLYNSQKSADFPKEKLLGFKIQRKGFRKHLILMIESNQRGIVQLDFNITFVNSKKINNIGYSLEKILRKNEKNIINQKSSIQIIQ